MGQNDYGDFRALDEHVQPTQDSLGADRIIRQESGQDFTHFYIRLKSQDVNSTFRHCQEALSQGAWFVFDRYCELLRLRHVTRLPSFAENRQDYYGHHRRFQPFIGFPCPKKIAGSLFILLPRLELYSVPFSPCSPQATVSRS